MKIERERNVDCWRTFSMVCYIKCQIRVTNAKNTKNFRQSENAITNAKCSCFLEMNVIPLLLTRHSSAPKKKWPSSLSKFRLLFLKSPVWKWLKRESYWDVLHAPKIFKLKYCLTKRRWKNHNLCILHKKRFGLKDYFGGPISDHQIVDDPSWSFDLSKNFFVIGNFVHSRCVETDFLKSKGGGSNLIRRQPRKH